MEEEVRVDGKGGEVRRRWCRERRRRSAVALAMLEGKGKGTNGTEEVSETRRNEENVRVRVELD